MFRLSLTCYDFGTHGTTLRTKDSVYGKRDGTIPGLAIVSKDPANHFRQTKGWKTGTVMNVPMLPRASMWKPESTVTWLDQAFRAAILLIPRHCLS